MCSRKFLLLFAGLTFVQACTVRIPMGQVYQTSHHGSQRIIPSYQVKKKGGKLAGYLGVTAGTALLFGGLGYAQAQDDKGNPYTNEQRIEKAKSGARVGLYLGGLYGIYVLVSKKKPPTTEQVTAANFNNWLSDYNRKQNQSLVPYDQRSFPYLLIPRNNVAAYEAEEKALVERAEAEKRARETERKRIAEAKEDSVYQKFRQYPGIYWDTYLDNYPNGRYADQVRERGEAEAYKDVIEGEYNFVDHGLSHSKSGVWEKYMVYFPTGKHAAIVREYRSISKELDAVHKLYYSAKYHADYVSVREEAEKFKTRLEAWYEEAGRNHGEIAASNPLTDLRGALRKRIDQIDRADKEAIVKEEKRRQVIAKWVVGDNLCWEVESFSKDEDGKRIKGSEGRTLIRLNIESISNGGERIYVKVKELYNLTKQRNADTFTMDSPVRVWKIDATDWINPQEMDGFDICK